MNDVIYYNYLATKFLLFMTKLRWLGYKLQVKLIKGSSDYAQELFPQISLVLVSLLLV